MADKIIYLDLSEGISGDMFLSSMIDLGVPLEYLKTELTKLNIKDFSIDTDRVESGHINGIQLKLGFECSQNSVSMNKIMEIIYGSSLEESVRRDTINMLNFLIDAEKKVHKQEPENLHLHELGSYDTIIDLTAAALCKHFFKGYDMYCSVVRLGCGIWNGMKVPAPATLQILRDVPVKGTEIEGELVTPTGAAIIKYLAKGFIPIPDVYIVSVGYGIGSRKYNKRRSALRSLNCDLVRKNTIYCIQANIDDMNPEYFEILMQRMYNKGAIEVFWTPIQMKKSRPGICLTALVEKDNKDNVIEEIFVNSTTMGMRYWEVERKILKQQICTLNTQWGSVKVKKGFNGAELLTMAPEYEDCKIIAEEHNISLKEVYNKVLARAYEQNCLSQDELKGDIL